MASDGRLRLATGLDFRHGVAIAKAQPHLGHARIDTITIYTKLTNPEHPSYADRVER